MLRDFHDSEFAGFTQTLTAVTLVNRTFVKCKIRVLNDARLVPVIERSFRYRREFIEWLARQDSAARAFFHNDIVAALHVVWILIRAFAVPPRTPMSSRPRARSAFA